MAGIDISQLPPLDVVEQVDYEEVRSDTVKRAGLENNSPSDPAYRTASATAYREVNYRQDANEQALGLSLAFAKGPELDHIGVTYHRTPRLAGELDDDYRSRIQEAPESLSVAGPDGAYRYFARSAHPDVKGAEPVSPEPVTVNLYVLSRVGDGVPTQDILDAVSATTEPVRPLSDKFKALPAEIIRYVIDAELFLKRGPDPELVVKEAIKRLELYISAQHRLKAWVTDAGIKHALKVEGVEDVRPNNWTDIHCEKYQAPYCTDYKVEIGGYVE